MVICKCYNRSPVRAVKCYKRNLLLLLLVFISCIVIFVYCHTMQINEIFVNDNLLSDHQTANINKGNRNYDDKPRSNLWRQRFPRIFIIGFGKAGTRVLYDTLLMHSKVVGPYKELRFFDEHYYFGISWYINQMPWPDVRQQVAEKSPSYVLNPDVPARIIKAATMFNVTLKELKFVVMFRHPIVRAISEYIEWQSSKVFNHGKLLARFDNLALNTDGQANFKDFQPLNHSLYAYYIKQWLQIFSPNQFCYVNGELFAEQPYHAISKLEECLELPPEISNDNFVWAERRQLFCLAHEGKVNCPALSKGRPHPFVQENVVDILMKHFKPFNEELYVITGENYNWENNYKGLNII